MRRILLTAVIVLAAGAFVVIAGGASNGGSSDPTYKIELDNAFGLVNGADFKVAGVRAGSITGIDLDQKSLHAVVTVQVSQGGFGSFRSDAFCQSRPQSLIGEYFVECQPGQTGSVLKSGSTIPVTRTSTTIPADLLNNVMRMPYRQRFTLIINELGAAVAGRSGDLQAALRRAVPALTETDNLLNLLANDSSTLQQLTSNSDAVITALANNSAGVQRFIVEANNAARDTATQQANLRATFHKLPAFLEQLRPTLAQLGAATDANLPVLANLNAASGQLNRLFTDLPGFAHASLPALKSLGKASVTGKVAAQAAGPTVAHLNKFAKHTPELGQNLAIVGHALDSRSRAVEADPRSPGGKGYTGLEALLQYVFNQTVAINTFGPFGHQLTVDAFADQTCSPYATAATLATAVKSNAALARKCYAWYGPRQPGINTTDPSNPSGCVPDPGGAPPGRTAPPTTACKLAADVSKGAKDSQHSAARARTAAARSSASASTGGGSSPPGSKQAPAINLQGTVGQILSVLGVGSSGSASSPSAPSAPSGPPPGGQAQQLLNYLLAP